MSRSFSGRINDRIHTYALKPKWVKKSLKIALALVSASGVIISGMLPIKAETSNSPPPLQTGDVVTASVDLTSPGLTIPFSFSGFSFEYGDILNYTGRTTDTINPVFVQLLKNIGDFNGPPIVRIGGNSTDESWWNPNGLAKPLGVHYNITPIDLSSLEASLSQTNSQLILGLNLGQNQPEIAVDLAKAALSRLAPNRVLSFEVGNESDIFRYHAYYKDSSGNTVNVRPSSYNFDQYLSEFNNYSSTLKKTFSRTLAAGTAFASYGWMKNYFLTFLSHPSNGQSQKVNLTTYHIYPLSACSWSKPGSSTDPTIPHLLSDRASQEPAQNAATFVNQAKQYGIPLSLSEVNSVSCGGTNGVSNSLASALWGTDVMFNMASVGVRSIHFHTGSGAYFSPFSFSVKRSPQLSVYKAKVNPLYYGMLLFAQAATNNSRLLTVNGQSAGNVKVWATIDSQNVVRVVAINKDTKAHGNAQIKLSSPRSKGSLVRLKAASASATSGVTLAGQTFDGTTNGKPVGNYVSTSVKPTNGIYTFSLPAASAALLTINP